MATAQTQNSKNLAAKTNLLQQIVVKIDGFNDLFGAVAVTEVVRVGDDITIGEFTVGGLITSVDSKDYISIEGTTSSINQQVNIEDGLPNSISRFNVELTDVNKELSEKFRPGNVVDDMLSNPVEIWVGFQGGSYPEDFTRVFIGIIDDIEFPQGLCRLGVSSPDKYRQSEIYQKFNTNLDGAIGSGDTTFSVDTTNLFLESVDILTSYIKITDEIMRVTSLTTTSFTVVRGELGTIAVPHTDNDEIESFYRLEGKPIDISLKTMISSSDVFYKTAVSATRFNKVTGSLTVPNSVFFPDINDVNLFIGAVEGDTVTITGAANASNNVTDAIISQLEISGGGSYIVLSGVTLVDEIESSAIVSFKSKYNTLPPAASFGINPRFIDVQGFESISAQNSSFFVDNDLYIKDTIEGEEFITKDILFPSGLFSTIRGGRTSAVFLSPPLVSDNAPVLNEFNVEKPDQLSIKRSVNDRFYNSIVYRFNQDVLEDKFLAGEIEQSATSTNRIKIPNKTLTIDAPGLRDTPSVRNMIKNVSDRLLQRYRFGAEKITVFVNYRDTYFLDLRDALILDGNNLNIANTISGSRDFQPRVMEIQDRSLNLKTGEVRLLLVDSLYNTESRYGTVSPASDISSGATTTSLPLRRSYGTSSLDEEFEKWSRLIGEEIQVRSSDFTYLETTTFNGFDLQQKNTMLIDALSVAPSEDYIVELIDYDESTDEINPLSKAIHVYLNRQVGVLTGLSSTSFTVSAGDITEFTEESLIRIHSEDFTTDSGDVNITDITGTTITVDDMGFTPTSADFVDRIKYKDGGDAYLYV